MTLRRLAAALLAAGCASVRLAHAAAPESVALLPLQNLSASEEGPGDLGGLLGKALESRGWRVTAGEPVEAALDEARVRYLDSVDAKTRAALTSKLDVAALAMGTVYAYSGEGQPLVAVSLRVVAADGRTICDDLVALCPEDVEGLFEFGREVTRGELTSEAVRRLRKAIPGPGEKPRAPERRGRPMYVSAPRTYRSAALADGTRHRVAILPFANAAFAREAPRVTIGLLARRLAASNLFDVVEPAELRTGLVAERVRDYGDPVQLKKLGARVGTTLFLSGTIYDYSEAPRGGNGTPRVDLELTLVDAATGKIVWTSYVRRQGNDYSGLLQLGSITNITALVDQVSYEMVHAAEKARPAHEPASKSKTGTSTTKGESKP